MKVIGLDLTSTDKKASGLACYDGFVYEYHLPRTDDDIVELCKGAEIIAIDSPLKLPRGFCCLEESCDCHLGKPNGRSCERELVRMGIPLYFTTKRSIIKNMIYRAIKLVKVLGEDRVIEIYPYSIKVTLFGKPIPNKSTQEGLLALKELISEVVNIPLAELQPLNHDICDAVLAAYTGYLFLGGKTLPIGDTDESPIVIPAIDEKYREIVAKRRGQSLMRLEV